MITVSIAVTARHVQSKSSASIRQLLGGLLALCTVALLVQPASCSAHSQIVQFLDTLPQLNASSTAADVQPLNLIIVLRDTATAESLQAICSRDRATFAKRAAKLKMGATCHLAGLCRHVYANYLTGMAGLFTPAELSRLGDCLPSGSISYIEQDFKVHKAERPQASARLQPAVPNQASQAVAAATSTSSHGKLTARRLLRKASEAAEAAETSSTAHDRSVPQSAVHAADGSSQQTTDPSLIKLTQAFLPASSLQAAGLSPAMYGGISPGSVQANAAPNTVEAANGPVPQSSSSGSTQYMRAGVKSQSLHAAQWNLDRVDQSSASLNQAFMFGSDRQVGTGRGVNIYTLDSGIRQSHQEFQPWQGSAHRVTLGPSFASDSSDSSDCDGHGTHIASTAGGRTVGVAKEASLVAVRVLDCQGAGQVSDVVAGLEWLSLNYKAPAVVTMSLGVQAGSWSQTLQTAVSNLMDNHGITIVVAAGNAQMDACQITPANVNGTISVAGSDMADKFGAGSSDFLYEYDNTGSCVDIFAPGVDIMAACGGAGRCSPLNDSNYAWASGTSMAVPHVAAAAAIYLSQNSKASPADVHQAIVGASSTGLLSTDRMLPGTPNRLLFVDRSVI